MTSDSQVLIVGAGPTGLTLACELFRHGVGCRIVDRSDGLNPTTRATDIQSRTLEVFADMGVLGAVLDAGHRTDGFRVFARGQEVARVAFDEADSPYPFLVGLPQSTLEHILERHLESLGGKVERNTYVPVVRHREHAEPYAVLLRGDHTWEEPAVDFVVGCDGAHSTVRQCVGESFEEKGRFDENFILADVHVDGMDWHHEDLSLYCSDDGVVLMMPLPDGVVRLFIDLHPDQERRLRLDTLQRLVDERCDAGFKLHNPGWMASFRIVRRQVDKYVHYDVLLAGDAAHVHSPIGGHGMNLGVQDAYNLAWKLALVVKRQAPHVLLHSYHDERQPVAAMALDDSDMETKMSLWRSPVAQSFRNQMLSLVSHLPRLRRGLVESGLELSCNYRKSPIVGEKLTSLLDASVVHSDTSERASLRDRIDFGNAPQPGDRAPEARLGDGPGHDSIYELLYGSAHNLLLFDGHADTAEGYDNLSQIAHAVRDHYGSRIETYVIVPKTERPERIADDVTVVLDAEGKAHARYGASAECLYLVRPDGYIGFRSQPADFLELERYLKSVFWW